MSTKRPTLSLPTTSPTVDSNTASIISDIHVGDPLGSSVRERLTVSVSHGKLTFGDTTGLRVTGGSYGSSRLTVRGNLHYLRTDLATLTYTSDVGYGGPDTLSLRLVDTTDNKRFAKGSLDITVLPPTIPTISVPTTSPTVTRGIDSPISGITVGDPTGTQERLDLSSSRGNITFGDTTGLTVTKGSYGSNSVTVTGTLADLQRDLATLSYKNISASNTQDTLSLRMINTTNNLSAKGSLVITVLAPPTPTITLSTPSLTVTRGIDSPISGITLGDPIGTQEELFLSTKRGALTFGDTTGLTVTDGSYGSNSVKVTGTLADLQRDLATLSYKNISASNTPDSLYVRLTDTTYNSKTNSSLAIPVLPPPSPTISVPTTSLTVTRGIASPISGITVGDPIGTKEQLVLSARRGTLTFGDTTGLTVTSGSYGSKSVTVTGDLADLQRDLGTLSYTSIGTYNRDTLSLGLTDTIYNSKTQSSLALTIVAPPP